MPEYATICGITEEEIKENFMPELNQMSEANNWSVEETHDRLKTYYDGYHFSEENMVDIYNPYSLVNALKQRKSKISGHLPEQRHYFQSLLTTWSFV